MVNKMAILSTGSFISYDCLLCVVECKAVGILFKCGCINEYGFKVSHDQRII
jgi:hypothetical protein